MEERKSQQGYQLHAMVSSTNCSLSAAVVELASFLLAHAR
jgi:hypothetical protein